MIPVVIVMVNTQFREEDPTIGALAVLPPLIIPTHTDSGLLFPIPTFALLLWWTGETFEMDGDILVFSFAPLAFPFVPQVVGWWAWHGM